MNRVYKKPYVQMYGFIHLVVYTCIYIYICVKFVGSGSCHKICGCKNGLCDNSLLLMLG